MLAGVFLTLGIGSPFDSFAPMLGLLALGSHLGFLGVLLSARRRP